MADGFVDPAVLDKVKVGKGYIAAKYGFRNHWYPAILSEEIEEEQVVPAQICGEKIIFKRIDGKVFCIKDQCVHKGVPLSRKVECYTKNTITCWYHGFTYRFEDGVLNGIVGVPESNVINWHSDRVITTNSNDIETIKRQTNIRYSNALTFYCQFSF